MGHLTKGFEQSKALAVGLGWFSVGLGLAELTAPGSVARLIGIRDDDNAVSLWRVSKAAPRRSTTKRWGYTRR